ncbi:MAG: dihydrofolate reductase, partial [bacterium]|nr:dihydrofolate reductase [bacterium]
SILGYLGKPLPERTNIVVTRHPDALKSSEVGPHWISSGVVVVGSLKEALEKGRALDAEEVHIGGGAQIYEQALPHIDKLYLTLVDDAPEADTFFPPYEKEFAKKTFEQEREWKGLKYRWVNLER